MVFEIRRRVSPSCRARQLDGRVEWIVYLLGDLRRNRDGHYCFEPAGHGAVTAFGAIWNFPLGKIFLGDQPYLRWIALPYEPAPGNFATVPSVDFSLANYRYVALNASAVRDLENL